MNRKMDQEDGSENSQEAVLVQAETVKVPVVRVPVVKTGSTDKHIVDDEPIEPAPISRPRSYRDLDAVPDDFD